MRILILLSLSQGLAMSAENALVPQAVSSALLVEEKFEDSNFRARGWYDNTGIILSSAEPLPGSTRSAEFRWQPGARTPASGGGIRRKFTPSEAVYLSYWVKYSTNYTGSNKPYHPHEFLFLTTRNGDWDGPAFTHLTGYIEHNEGVPILSLQDGQNIDQTRIGQDLTLVTENRSVCGCNGNTSDGYTLIDCYRNGANFWNGKIWKAKQSFFQDVPGRFYKSDWHHVEAYFKLNTISGGKGIPDGQLKYWFDGESIIDQTNVLMRTAASPSMKWNQFIIAPYIGDGSPVDQTMWVDNLRIATSRLVADTDADGMPDDWEAAHGFGRFDPSDSTQDPDGDRFTNLHEYLAGTDPLLSASALRIRGVTFSGSQCVIDFTTVPGKSYELQRCPDLAGGVWSSVSTNVGGAGGSAQINDAGASSSARQYYRVKLVGS